MMIETTPATRRPVGSRGSLKDQSADPATGKTFKFLASVKVQATVPRRKAAAAVEERREEEERQLRLARQQEESVRIDQPHAVSPSELIDIARHLTYITCLPSHCTGHDCIVDGKHARSGDAHVRPADLGERIRNRYPGDTKVVQAPS